MTKGMIIVMLTLLQLKSVAQKQPCGNPRIDTAAMLKAEGFAARGIAPLAVNNMIRVYFYIAADNDGSNAAATPDQIKAEFNQLVSDYAPNNLCFAYMGLRYIYDTNINKNIVADSTPSAALLNPWRLPNCITIFYQTSLLKKGGGTYGGYAYGIPSNACSVAKGNIGGTTISHEIGHCLGLIHTQETNKNVNFENINGDNCSTVGDRVCDTPADPFERPCAQITACVYTGGCTDGNGQSNYTPPYNNIMSYWCTSTSFTNGQYARVNSYINTDAGLRSTLSATSSATFGPANFNNVTAFVSDIYEMTSTGTVTNTGNCIIGYVARKVRLTSGFRASPTTGKVEIRSTICNY